MNRKKNWRKQFKKNWKIWLVSILLALVLVGRGVSAFIRGSAKPASTTNHVTAVATATP